MGRLKTPEAGKKCLFATYTYNNPKNEAAHGKTYARTVVLGTLSTEDIAEHMMHHGCLYGVDVIKGVLEKFYDCALEQLFCNYRVKMDGLGTLCLGINSQGADSAGEFTADKIEKACIYLLPDGTTEQQLTGAKLRSRMTFANITSRGLEKLAGESSGSGSSEGGNGGNDTPDIDDLP